MTYGGNPVSAQSLEWVDYLTEGCPVRRTRLEGRGAGEKGCERGKEGCGMSRDCWGHKKCWRKTLDERMGSTGASAVAALAQPMVLRPDIVGRHDQYL